MAMKLAVVIGHTSTSGGAKGIGIAREYDYNTVVAEDMRVYAQGSFGDLSDKPIEVKLFRRDGIGVSGAYELVDEWQADLSVELHYNAASSSAKGTETLSSGSSGSLEFANQVQTKLCTLLNRSGNSRGIKIRNRTNKERGWLSLVSGRAPAIITEPAFGSNPADAALLKNKQLDIGRSIVDGAVAVWYE